MKKSTKLTHGYYMKQLNEQHGKVIAEYIWIDGTGINLRSKARTLDHTISSLEELPEWNYDGSSTMQAETHDSEVILKPVNYFPDPFRGGDNILVLCSTYKRNGEGVENPVNTNFRHFAEPIMKNVEDHQTWFGLEQEYTLFARMDVMNKTPLGWPTGGYPVAQGPYYCGVGAKISYGRVVQDLHYKACLHAGINISGTNAESMPGQWEFQVGPCEGIQIGDHLWMARYILGRVTEDLNIGLSFEPKPVKGNWAGAGCHVNFSTIEMRNEGGYEHIQEAIEKLSLVHKEHILVYGKGNEHRLHGKNETCHIDMFKAGVADRTASVRIPSMVKLEGKGYFEDRRPASNIDPYLVAAKLCSTILLDGKDFDKMNDHHINWVTELNNLDK